MMDELERARQQIDRADREIVAAYEKRINAVKQVAQYKIEYDMQVLDRSREQDVLESRADMMKDPSLRPDAVRLFGLLMSMSRSYQQAIIDEHEKKAVMTTCHGVAAFQGDHGANSEAALIRFFGEGATTCKCREFDDVFAAVVGGEAEYGVLPVENSSTGSVAAVYDLLNQYPVYIVGELQMKIENTVMGLPGAEIGKIRDVYSHEQALMQCADFLNSHPEINRHPYFNTAVSAKFVAESGDITKAAIASEYAASIYGLEILVRDINMRKGNTTRFIVIAQKPLYEGQMNKASVSFVLEHKTGALAKVLDIFARHGLNMVKIESRPLENRNFEYVFYVDFEGENIGDAVAEAARQGDGLFAEFTLHGVYRR